MTGGFYDSIVSPESAHAACLSFTDRNFTAQFAAQSPDGRPWRQLVRRSGEPDYEKLFDWPRDNAKAFLIEIRQRRNKLVKKTKNIKRIIRPFFHSSPSQLTMTIKSKSCRPRPSSSRNKEELILEQAAAAAAAAADPAQIESVMKRRRGYSERESKDVSLERQKKLDAQCACFNEQPMEDVYDLRTAMAKIGTMS